MARKMPITAVSAEVPALALKAMAKALKQYEILVVSEAQELAPVRQAFKNPKGQRKRTRSLVGTDLDSGMQALLPGEKVTKALIGTGRGRGSRMLIRRHSRGMLNRRAFGYGRSRRDIVLGRNEHRKDRFGEKAKAFVPGPEAHGGAHQISTKTTNKTLVRGGRHSATVKGYEFQNQFLQSSLTSRARSNLARGIGVNRTTGAASPTAAGNLILGGALRDSIHSMGVEATDTGLEVRITASVRYAPYVEFGTYKDVAQPFMRPAIKNTKKKLGPLLKNALRGTGFTAKG